MIDDELSGDQRLFLETALENFRRTGEWPILRDIQRELVRRIGRTFDVFEVAASLPEGVYPYAQHLHNPAMLNVRTLALCDDAEEELSDFLRVVGLAAEKYFGDEQEPTISSQELAERFGMSELRLRKVDALLRIEPSLVNGGTRSDSPFSWEWQVADSAHQFKSAETVVAYLETQDLLQRRSTKTLQAPLAGRRPAQGEDQKLSLDGFHSRVRSVAEPLWRSGHYMHAIFAAFKAVELRVQDQSGLAKFGKDLMATAFGGESPLIRIAHEDQLTGRAEQDGYKFLFMGAMQGIRNAGAHGTPSEMEAGQALEYLAFASLLMHKLDEAQ